MADPIDPRTGPEIFELEGSAGPTRAPWVVKSTGPTGLTDVTHQESYTYPIHLLSLRYFRFKFCFALARNVPRNLYSV